MRKPFAQAVAALAACPDMVFLTGDLGFHALESVRDAFGERFLNCGIAEQNMVSMAAGMARDGWRPWVYSIAPFVYARPFEQIRNDICMHHLPVRLVGNGGGYGYGAQGSTHHALEDCAAMSALPGMRVLVPALDEDIPEMVAKLMELPDPAYFRLGFDESKGRIAAGPYAPWRRVASGPGLVLCVLGPLVWQACQAAEALPPEIRPEVWVVTELPVREVPPPDAFCDALASKGALCVVEEHFADGGLGAQLLHHLCLRGCAPHRVAHLCAHTYCGAGHGSQAWERQRNGLDAEGIVAEMRRIVASAS